jgi:hypothetical protein
LSVSFGLDLREQIQGRVQAGDRRRSWVVAADSLWLVVAYETLCLVSQHRAHAFVTIEPSLAISNLIFDRLHSAAVRCIETWPASTVVVLANTAHRSCSTALVKGLAPLLDIEFTSRPCDGDMDTEANARGASPYLTDRLTTRAITDGLHAR